jgi:hypothetical protein
MKTIFIRITVLFFFFNLCLNTNAQNAKNDVTELNSILKNSLFATTIEIDNSGIVSRKDNNGNTFTYSLNDVSSITYDDDGFHNVIIILKESKMVKGVVGGKKGETTINVIAFADKTECDKTIEILKKMIYKND